MIPEALKSEQKKIFEKLKYFPEFYLAGGTGLALQIGHRISVDFDLFSKKEIPANFLAKVRRVFKEFKIKILVKHLEQLSVLINGTRVDFVKYNFPPIKDLIEYKGVKLLSVSEIAASKAFTIGQRITLKDYVDLYFVLKGKFISLPKLINLCEKKYKEEFNGRLFLEQLISPEEAEETPIEFLKNPVTKKEIVDFFEKEIKKLKL